ncbi:hypothetical protein PHYPSEUDO_002385 [Phytophthora pseudosyringae]|uniref:Uncharacterized protein n=1 Tax=Phytophthora pseudosyringae TaxID=221518 RepID=A0A8T1VTC5_9STRA|nr:hypothetical protein PHYPSEUDO_002385 [Phytophthora pseudosyringae]
MEVLEGVPEPPAPRSLSFPSLTSTSSRLSSWKRVEKNWNQAQVGHQGSYSVERLELLDRYCNNTSLTRVILVCVSTPLPALAVALGLECLPLRPPSEGWAANWMFWIRLSFMALMLNLVGVCQVNLFVPGFSQSVGKVIYASVGVCALQIGTFVFEAAAFGFPVPFMWQFGGITMAIYVPVVTRVVYGPALVLYDLIPRSYRGIVVILIPMWKFAAKRFAVRMTREMEDFVPELVAFSVDFFSALFVSVCMATSGSFHLTALLIAVDLFFSFVKFRELHKDDKVLRQLLEERRRSESSRLIPELFKSDSAGLIPMILDVVHDPSAYHVTSLDRVRLWASPPHLVPDKLYERLQSMGASGIFGNQCSERMRVLSYDQAPRSRLTPWKFQQISVVPAPMTLVPVVAPLRSAAIPKWRKESSVRPTDPSKSLVRHGLHLLFQFEYLVLVEYIECVVPFVVVAYKSALEQLPNVVYFPGGAGRWGVSAVTNLLVLGVLEVGSLLLVHAFVQRKFGVSPLYELAFVLETQVSAVQAHLFQVIIFLLQYELAHLGVDFTFRFDWLRDTSK